MSNEPDFRSSRTRNLAISATILIAVGAFILGFSLRTNPVDASIARQAAGQAAAQSAGGAVEASQDWPTPPPTFTPFARSQEQLPRPTPTALPPPTWSELGSLASVRFNVSTIVTEERQQLLGTDRVLLMVVGDVLMGIDLSQIAQEDVQIEGRKISIALPPASIIGVELQLEKSQIYDSSSALIWSDYTGLEKTAIGRAQRQIYDHAATDPNMIQTTELLAKLQLSEFLKKAGFKDVDITYKEQTSQWDD